MGFYRTTSSIRGGPILVIGDILPEVWATIEEAHENWERLVKQKKEPEEREGDEEPKFFPPACQYCGYIDPAGSQISKCPQCERNKWGREEDE